MVEAIIVSNDALDKEIAKLTELCAPENIEVYNDKALKIHISYTELKTCSLQFRFTTDDQGEISYPENAKAHFELKSNSMPPRMVQLFIKKIEKHIEEQYKEKKEHVLSTYQFLTNALENNNLLPCFFEFAQIKQVIDPKKGDVLKPLEKAGKLKVTLKEGEFFANMEFVVPPMYPMQSVKFTVKEHNFNSVFADIFVTHTNNIIRRLWGGGQAGYDPKENYDVNEGKIGLKKAAKGVEAELKKVGVASRAELKHDMDYIKKQNELRSGAMDK